MTGDCEHGLTGWPVTGSRRLRARSARSGLVGHGLTSGRHGNHGNHRTRVCPGQQSPVPASTLFHRNHGSQRRWATGGVLWFLWNNVAAPRAARCRRSRGTSVDSVVSVVSVAWGGMYFVGRRWRAASASALLSCIGPAQVSVIDQERQGRVKIGDFGEAGP
jgi:hypothetical protein